ncbi:hypothetical protein [Aquimarina macrocephali]|uniref:hypothetical protein n=1 Tax=Aquimarina macrocephali TaxID=666563 RepID=UPI000464CF9B|nr:hypothetical protein [Aquimarina macrocephali]
MKPKNLCLLGLILFVTSYVMFSQGQEFAYAQKPIDFAHWFNLIAAVLLISFNYVFPKNNLNSIASFVTILGVIAHIGLCTIDLIMWSFGSDNVSRAELSNHLNNIPSIVYPFVIVGPSMLFIGLSLHAWNFIRKHTISALMVIIGAPAIGIAYFMLHNGILTLASCIIFSSGLAILLYRNEIQNIKNNELRQDI